MTTALKIKSSKRLSTFSNPYTAVLAIVDRNPRAAFLIGGSAVFVMAMAVLIVLSSVQAFLMISQQSATNTRNRLTLVAAANPAAGDEDGAGLAGSDDAGVTDAALALAAAGVALLTGDDGPDQPAPAEATPASTQSAPPAVSSPAPNAAPTAPVSSSDVVSVYGIRVHTSIAGDVRAMIDAAAEDGVTLSGWGWRDSATQIRLRREHCGTSEYAIYRMPSSQCRPPTARPGSSQHERGLAVDFTYNGGSISSRRSPGFQWLDEHAAAYGFKNLASEPWHWSTTGR